MEIISVFYGAVLIKQSLRIKAIAIYSVAEENQLFRSIGLGGDRLRGKRDRDR